MSCSDRNIQAFKKEKKLKVQTQTQFKKDENKETTPSNPSPDEDEIKDEESNPVKPEQKESSPYFKENNDSSTDGLPPFIEQISEEPLKKGYDGSIRGAIIGVKPGEVYSVTAFSETTGNLEERTIVGDGQKIIPFILTDLTYAKDYILMLRTSENQLFWHGGKKTVQSIKQARRLTINNSFPLGNIDFDIRSHVTYEVEIEVKGLLPNEIGVQVNLINDEIVHDTAITQNGIITLKGMAANSYKLTYLRPNKPHIYWSGESTQDNSWSLKDQEASWIKVDQNLKTNIIIDLSKELGTTVTGRILDQNNNPMPDTRVTINDQNQDYGRSLTTNENGQFKVGGLIPGKYRIDVNTDSHGFYNGEIEITGEEESPLSLGDLYLMTFEGKLSTEIVGDTNYFIILYQDGKYITSAYGDCQSKSHCTYNFDGLPFKEGYYMEVFGSDLTKVIFTTESVNLSIEHPEQTLEVKIPLNQF